MLEFDQSDRVRDVRQSFENEMTERLTSMIEDLMGRKVVSYQSQVMFDPDAVAEMFMSDDPAPHEPRAATAEGQVTEGSAGEARTDEFQEPPAASGQ